MQVEEARKKESERTGKVNEDMAKARSDLKQVDKEMRSLQVSRSYLRNTSTRTLAPCHCRPTLSCQVWLVMSIMVCNFVYGPCQNSKDLVITMK